MNGKYSNDAKKIAFWMKKLESTGWKIDNKSSRLILTKGVDKIG